MAIHLVDLQLLDLRTKRCWTFEVWLNGLPKARSLEGVDKAAASAALNRTSVTGIRGDHVFLSTGPQKSWKIERASESRRRQSKANCICHTLTSRRSTTKARRQHLDNDTFACPSKWIDNGDSWATDRWRFYSIACHTKPWMRPRSKRGAFSSPHLNNRCSTTKHLAGPAVRGRTDFLLIEERQLDRLVPWLGYSWVDLYKAMGRTVGHRWTEWRFG